MSIIVVCPACHKQCKFTAKKCKCGCDLQKAKKNKQASLYVTYRVPGSRKLFREPAGKDVQEAKDIEANIRLKKKSGSIAAIGENRNMDFNELSDWYLELEINKALAHYGIKQIHLKKFCEIFGDRKVHSILPADLEDYQVIKRNAGESDSYIDQQISTVRHMVGKGIDNNIVSADTLRAFRKVKKLLKRNANARERVLSEPEYHRLYDAAAPHLKPILATAYYTGMRRGEILGLTWNRVFLKEKLIRLRAEDTKDREARNIPMCAELMAEFRRIPRALHIREVFLYRGKPMKDIRAGLRNACKKAGMKYGRNAQEGITLHDLRRTFVTRLRKEGLSEKVIMAITGHSTREVFDRYNIVDMDDLHNAVEKVFGAGQ
jgi:integrase